MPPFPPLGRTLTIPASWYFSSVFSAPLPQERFSSAPPPLSNLFDLLPASVLCKAEVSRRFFAPFLSRVASHPHTPSWCFVPQNVNQLRIRLGQNDVERDGVAFPLFFLLLVVFLLEPSPPFFHTLPFSPLPHQFSNVSFEFPFTLPPRSFPPIYSFFARKNPRELSLLCLACVLKISYLHFSWYSLL